MELIRARVDAVRGRHQRQWMWQCASWGLVFGGLAGCLVGALRGLSGDAVPWIAIALAVLAGPGIGLVFAMLRPRPLREAAVAIDRGCGLKDRVATALRFIAESHAGSPIRELQIADAASHLARIDPAQVAPIRAPKPWYWGLGLNAAAVVIGFLTAPPQQAVATVVTNDVVTAQALRMADELEELKQFSEEDRDPEIEKLLKELASKIEELKQPGVDPKEALAKLSEMEAALHEHQQQLADQNVESSLKEVGEALALSEPLASAGQALSQGNMEKAAEELAKLEMPELDRKTERAVTEKLDQQAKQNPGSGSQRKLREATGQVSQGLSQGDRSKFKDGMQGLAGEAKKQGQRKKLSDLLRKQCQCLSECKGECEGECKNNADSNKKGGKKWGLGRSGNEPGDPTAKLKTGEQMKLTGQESASGESDVETLSSPEQEQTAVRQYREQVKKYEQLAESALEAEPIPLGHRQTIRRYFELIRPQNAETDAVLEQMRDESAAQ
jgi:hypothetical protein